MSGTVERAAATAMIVRHSPGARRITVGGDKASTPLTSSPTCAPPCDAARRSKHNRPPFRHRWPHHAASGLRDQPAETQAGRGAFGSGKTIGGLARPMLRGVKRLYFKFIWTMAAYDLIKLPRLIGAAAAYAPVYPYSQAAYPPSLSPIARP